MIWFRFGLGDSDGLNRITSKHAREELVPQVEVGDIILTGTKGKVSHVMVYVGGGETIHSMATHRTQRSVRGRIADAVLAPLEKMFRLATGRKAKQGVIRERVDSFFGRFYRDSYIVMRHPDLTDEESERGVKRLESLLGKGYDWDFDPDNDRYYCTELAVEFYLAAMGENAPRLAVHSADFPVIFHREGLIGAEDVLSSPDLIPVLTSPSVADSYEKWINSREDE